MSRDRLTRFLFRWGFVPLNRTLYRLTGGAIGGSVRGAPVLLLRVRGRRTGTLRTTPLLYLVDGARLVCVASAGGAPSDPDWLLNLRAQPDAEVQLGRERRLVRAREATAAERETLWPRLTAVYPDYDLYQARTSRTIPVVILEPRSPAG